MLETLKSSKWLPVWIDIPPKSSLIENTMDVKHIKSCPHEYKELRQHDYVIHMDNKLGKINDEYVETLVQQYFIQNNYALLIKEHPFGYKGVWDEFRESMLQWRYVMESDRYCRYIRNQLQHHHLKDKTTHHCWAGLLIRNMKHPRIESLNNTWYSHIQECGIQDQISFYFVKQLFEDDIYIFEDHINWYADMPSKKEE
jgi:hypothetical protein